MNKQTQTTEGKVEKISMKDGKYGIQVNGIWYNGFGNPEVDKGQTVLIEFEQKGQWKNIKNLDITNSTIEQSDKSKNIEDAARLRRILDCVLSADSDFRAGVIKKEEVSEHAEGLYALLNSIDSTYKN